MALSETSRMDYERLLLENKPSLTDNERRSPDKTVLGFDVGGIAGAEKLVLKLVTDKGCTHNKGHGGAKADIATRNTS